MLNDKLTYCIVLSCVASYSYPICLLVMVFLILKEVSSCCLLSRDRSSESSKWYRVIPNPICSNTAIVQEAARAAGHVKMPREKPVAVVLWCHLRRPDSDFVSRTRACGRLKPEAIRDDNTMVAIKPDNDNLAKLLLEALTGVLCTDDAQIVDLRVYKLRDNVGLCEGRIATEVDVFKKSVAEMSPNF